MKSVLVELTSLFSRAIDTAFPGHTFQPRITQATKREFGDYQCNNAMEIHKVLKSKGVNEFKSPRDVAQTIVGNLQDSERILKQTKVEGPGFINVFLSQDWVASQLTQVAASGVFLSPPARKHKCIVDFSSPNIAKEMHVGHLRSTIIGDTICRLLEFCGHEVVRVNHIGDWGTQFGMLISHLKDAFPDFLENPPAIGDLQVFYKAAKKRFDDDPLFKKRSQLEVVQLQGGNETSLAAWRLICDISRKEFQKIYDRIDIHLEEKGESFYNPLIPKVIEECTQKGLVQESNGAQCIFIEGQQIPLIVRKSDGGFSYDSTDLAAIWYRSQVEKGDWLIYVVDTGQAQHFDLIFAAARKAGWVTPSIRVDHVGFGVVLGEDGTKLKSRSGDTVRLVDLLDEAQERALKGLQERENELSSSGGERRMTPEEMAQSAEIIAYSAIKYADLKNNRITTYKFSYDQMLSMTGNTAVYLLYSYVRIASIARKAGVNIQNLKESGTRITLDHDAEYQLARTVLKLPEVIDTILASLCPNVLCDYLYDLSIVFNEFFRDCRVIGDEKQDSRLLLCEATAETFRTGFKMLGVQWLDKI